MRLRVVVTAIALVCWACDASDGERGDVPDPGPAGDTTGADTGTEPDVPATPFSGDMTGRWVQVQERAAMVEMLPSNPGKRLTRTWFVVDVTQDALAVSARYTACAVEVESPEGGAVTTIPRNLVDRIPVSDRPADLSDEGGVWRFTQPEHVELRGVRDLSDPANDDLPTDPLDPRIWDQDNDGQPGVTVFVDVSAINLDVYVAQRIVTALEGTVVADGCFEGTVAWSEDQVILGGYDVSGQAGGVLDALLTRPGIEPEDDGNRFRMTRADGVLATGDPADACEAVLADRVRWGW